MLPIDLAGKRAFVAGVADDGGFGFAIAKSLAEAGATVVVGTWPPAYGIFTTMLERGKFDESRVMANGQKLTFERIYPLDADFDVAADLPADLAQSRRYRDHGDVSIDGVAQKLTADFGPASPRHRHPLPGQRTRSKKSAPRDQPQGVPGRRRCERLFVCLDGAAVGAAGPSRLIVLGAQLPGRRARRARLRRRHVVGLRGARIRHAPLGL